MATNSNLNERVARALGRERIVGGRIGQRVLDWPDYEHDLNACREIIAEVDQRGLWNEWELAIIRICKVRLGQSIMRAALLATPEQLCRAFLACVEPEAAVEKERKRG